MIISLSAMLVLAVASECPAEPPQAAPDPGAIFDYQSMSTGERAFTVLLRNEIVTRRGSQSAFRQGGGLTADTIEMPQAASVRGHYGILFPVQAGNGPRRRDWSYSPDPESFLSELSAGESGEVFVSERQGGTNRRYTLHVRFVGCEIMMFGEEEVLTRRYRLQSPEDASVRIDREVWISQDEAWWVRETDHRLSMETILISTTSP